MGIAEEIKDALRREEHRLELRPTVRRLEAFYAELVKKGLVTRPQYTLPLPDTIGAALTQNQYRTKQR